MYKKLFSALLLAGMSAVSFAQSTLTAANFTPAMWEKYINHICDTTGIVQGASGANITWDFTALVTTTIDTGQAMTCSATPGCSHFPGSTYAIVSHATHLVPYYIATSAKISQDGYYLSVDTNAVYTDQIEQIHFPFTYLNSYTDAYAGIVTLGPVSAHENGTISVTCDGYGTLKLPGGIIDANVLRVHSSQTFIDSASLFGFPLITTFQLETYTWYMPNYHSPLLTILTTQQVGGPYYNKAVSYAPVALLSAPTVMMSGSTMELFPNPAKSELNIKYTTENNEQVRISLMDMTGREIAVIADHNTQGVQNISFNTSALPKGLYIVRMLSGTETVTRKIEIQ